MYIPQQDTAEGHRLVQLLMTHTKLRGQISNLTIVYKDFIPVELHSPYILAKKMKTKLKVLCVSEPMQA